MESSSSSSGDSSNDEDFEVENVEDFDFNPKVFERGDFLLVRFQGKKSCRHYVGRVEEVEADGDLVVNFMRRKLDSRDFIFPETADISSVPVTDVVLKLPPPLKSGGTQRTRSLYSFELSFQMFTDVY